MSWLKGLFSKPSNNSLFPGKRLPIDEILKLRNSTEMIIELSYGISDKINKNGYDSLSQVEKVLHHVYWLESEVNNGGFHQYFSNSSGDYAFETPEACKEIGAPYTASLVDNANNIFPNGKPPSDWQQRNNWLNENGETIKKTLGDIDNKFFEYREPLAELQKEYMEKYKGQIIVSTENR
jgi:hypothetical protein